MANDQSLRVNILGDATGLNQALNKADAQLKQFGKRAKDIGRTLTTRLTLPIGAAGFASALSFLPSLGVQAMTMAARQIKTKLFLIYKCVG